MPNRRLEDLAAALNCGWISSADSSKPPGRLLQPGGRRPVRRSWPCYQLLGWLARQFGPLAL